LLDALNTGAPAGLRAVLDVWAEEPDVDPELLRRVALGTPHIAGYSLEGRVRGSLMIFDALCAHLGISEKMRGTRRQVCAEAFGSPRDMPYQSLEQCLLESYPIARDSEQLRAHVKGLPESFDALRKHYPVRREYDHYRVRGAPPQQRALLAALGFLIDEQ
jgi:erythronate-4-phosphate dehydrogenase